MMNLSKWKMIKHLIFVILIFLLPSCAPTGEPSEMPCPTLTPVAVTFNGLALPTPRPIPTPIPDPSHSGSSIDVQEPPVWLVLGNQALLATVGSNENYRCGMLQHADAVPPQEMGDFLATASVLAEAEAVIVVGSTAITKFQATVQPWIEVAAAQAFDPLTGRQLKADEKREGDVMVLTLEPIGDTDDQILAVFITYDMEGYQAGVTYLWRLNPAISLINAVYLVQNSGQLSTQDLKAHPEVRVTNTFEDFKRYALAKAALWVDRDAVSQVDMQWLHEMPQKYYPLVLVGESNELCAFKETLTGFGIEGPQADCTVQVSGFSIWMLREETSSSTSAFMQGYEQKPLVQDILDITNNLLKPATK